SKGANGRATVAISATAAATPVGPAGAPSTFPQTTLGGYWSFRVTDDATGAPLMGFGTTMSLSATTVVWTTLGGTMTPGVHTFTLNGENRWISGENSFAILSVAPVTQTCTASITVVAE
ncbi:MAG: hypothetical protein ABMA00_19165, partial [Gemmatimonas sp.]